MGEKTVEDQSGIKDHPVVSHEEWLSARTAFLAKEKEFTRLRDELSRQRRELPWERLNKEYIFEGPKGRQTLAELFDGRSQLIVYHFMFGPGWDAGCPHCSFWADNFDGIIVHLNQRDATMIAVSRAPSQTWRTFLANHAKTLVSSDFFVVPTVFFRVLFVFVILSHDRRRPAHVAVAEHPTSEWVAHQLLEAFPWDSAARYLLRDRDGSYGERFSEAARLLGIREVLTAPQSPWQNPYVERLIGSIRRECLDHVIVLNETRLRRMLKSYFDYYERSRTHLSLGKDAPIARPIQPIGTGKIMAIPQVGGLHHRYERIAA